MPVVLAVVALAMSVLFFRLGRTQTGPSGLELLRHLDGDEPATAGNRRAGFGFILELPYRFAPERARAWLAGRMAPLCDSPGLEVPRLAGIAVYACLIVPVALLMLLRFSKGAIVVSALCAALGALAPRLIASRSRARYLEGVRQALPDVADLLYANVLGGKNLDQAFRSAADLASPPLDRFLARAVREMDLGSTRDEAFERLIATCPVSELSSLLRSLLEAERRGHSLSGSLAIFSREIRLRRRDTVREAGAKAPLKMLVPLVCLILPASVLLTVGPTFLLTLKRVF